MKTTDIIQLPDTVTQYMEAANCFDAASAAACFATNANVHDENVDYVGLAAIENWILDTSSKYQPQVSVVAAETKGQTMRLTVLVSGNFPSSPAVLTYDIRLQDNKIEQLTIR